MKGVHVSDLVMSGADVRLVEMWKKEGALVPIDHPSGPKRPAIVCVACNAGRQLLDRVQFYNELFADFHPVLSHGGGVRLSGPYFDESVVHGVIKARRLTRHPLVGLETHWPCAYCTGEKHLDLRLAALHTLGGIATLQKKFGVNGNGVYLFHFDYRGCPVRVRRPMESFEINPSILSKHL